MRGAAAVTVACVSLALAGCSLGTMSEEELFADYEVQPESEPAELIREVFEEVADEVDSDTPKLAQLTLMREGGATLLVQHPGERGRLYRFYYDGFWLNEGELESTEVDDASLFALSELPLDALAAMIEAGRARMTFSPASLTTLTIERDERAANALRVTVSYRSFEDSGSATFDGTGALLGP